MSVILLPSFWSSRSRKPWCNHGLSHSMANSNNRRRLPAYDLRSFSKQKGRDSFFLSLDKIVEANRSLSLMMPNMPHRSRTISSLNVKRSKRNFFPHQRINPISGSIDKNFSMDTISWFSSTLTMPWRKRSNMISGRLSSRMIWLTNKDNWRSSNNIQRNVPKFKRVYRFFTNTHEDTIWNCCKYVKGNDWSLTSMNVCRIL